MIIITFGFFLIFFILVGVLSALKSKRTNEDYLFANYQETPFRIALSAVATNNSGYMFIGFLGYTYLYGISAIWIMISILLGDFCASLFIHKKMRMVAEQKEALTFLEVIGRWNGKNYHYFRSIGAIILIIFLSIYAAAQFKAGGKVLNVLFGFDYRFGSLLGALVVLCYVAGGGIRASIWTNTVQSFVMILSMLLVFIFALDHIGGFGKYFTALQNISPQYVSLFPESLYFKSVFGLLLFCVGWFFGGFGVVGQAHIMTIFMATSKPNDIKKIRHYYYGWYSIFFTLILATGFAARILVPMNADFDPEFALPSLAQQILPEMLIGFVLAGLFAATMSTADSQIISCAAAITNDLFAKKHPSFLTVKITTIIFTLFAVLISITDDRSVFELVAISWQALACAFSPILLLYVFKQKMSEKMMITIMLLGVATMLIWHFTGLEAGLHEMAAATLVTFIYYFVVKKFSKNS